MRTPNPRHPISPVSRAAFTIIELLVVIVIGLVILSIAIPAFQSMTYSSNRSLAVNALQAASQMAHDVALSTGRDGAVVFVYDPQVGKIQIIPAVMIGTLREKTTAASGPGSSGGGAAGGIGGASALGDAPYFDRDVFVPASAGETLEMPHYWMVRGYASPHSMIDRDSAGNPAAVWYTSDVYGGTQSNDVVKAEDHWVFPETGFFPYDAQISGGRLDGQLGNPDATLPTTRQTFMIRFSARSGVLSRDTSSALFVDPRNSRERPYGDSPSQYEQTLRADLSDDLEVWATRVLSSPDLNGDGRAWGRQDSDLRQQLLGNVSNDTILVKPVTRIALYDERQLAIALGLRGLNKSTLSLYAPADQEDRDARIEFDSALYPSGLSDTMALEMIDQWIDGDTNFDGSLDLDDAPQSRLYLIQSYTGELQEVLR